MQKQTVFKYLVILSICSCIALGTWDDAFGAVEEDISLEELQQQIIALRKEFKLRITKAEKDRQSIYENIRKKIRGLGKKQEDFNASPPELTKQIQELLSVFKTYSAQIDVLEKTVDTMEKTMNQNLDIVEKRFAAIKKQGVRRPSVTSTVMRPAEPESEPGSSSFEFSAGELFRIAYRYYRENDYETAIAGFYKYLEEYPNTQLTGAAQYWIAESLAKMEEYDIALQEYDRLINTYPRNDKISDAHYGIGVALLKLGKTTEAESKFTYVIKNFSGTIAARKSGNRLEELR